MEWTDKAIFLSGKPCGEAKYIVTVFTNQYGLKKGLISNKKISQTLQPGVILYCKWNARLQEHLGILKTEVEYSPLGRIFFSQKKIIFLKAIADLFAILLPEGHVYEELYEHFSYIVKNIHTSEFNIIKEHIVFELLLIRNLGFAIDLKTACSLCNIQKALYYFSPKSGKGCCKECGDIYSDKLLIFDQKVFIEKKQIPFQNYIQAIELTGFYLLNHVLQGKNQQKIIAIRNSIINLIQEEESAA